MLGEDCVKILFPWIDIGILIYHRLAREERHVSLGIKFDGCSLPASGMCCANESFPELFWKGKTKV